MSPRFVGWLGYLLWVTMMPIFTSMYLRFYDTTFRSRFRRPLKSIYFIWLLLIQIVAAIAFAEFMAIIAGRVACKVGV